MAVLDKVKAALGYGQDEDGGKSDAEKCAQFVDQLYSQAQDTLSPLYRQWYEQLMWVLGEHYLEYSDRFERFIVRPERSYIPRATANLILDLAERAVSFLTKSNVTGHVIPEGVAITDYQKARNAERILKKLWVEDLMDLKRRIANCWAVYTGNAIFLTGLDAVNKPVVEIPEMAEVPVADPDTGMPMMDPETGGPLMMSQPTGNVERTIALAEVSSDPINPMEIVPDPYAKNPWEMRYWLHHRAVDIDVLADEYGNDIKDQLKPDNALRTSHQYQNKLMDLITRSSGAGRSYGLSSAVVDSKLENAVVVKTFYRLPCRSYPKGEMLVHAAGKVLDFQPYRWVNEKGRAYRNIHWYGWSIVPGCLWRFGLVRNLVDPQKRLNGMLTQVGLNRKAMGNAQWMVPKGCGFDEEGTSKPGKVYLWSPKGKLRGAKPEPIPPVGMAPDFWKELETHVAHMDRISGLNDVLRGENPPGVDAGVSLEFLAERATGRFAPGIDEMRSEIKTMEEFRLFMVTKSPAWAFGKRMMVDENGVKRVVNLTNLDAPDDPSIEMEATTSVLWTEASKRKNTEAMLAAGLIDLSLPENRRLLRDTFNASQFKDATSSNAELAEKENQQLLEGRPVKVRPFENPAIHLPMHVKLTLADDYPTMPEEIRLVVEAHIAETQDALRLMKAMELEAAAPPDLPPGTPGAPGEQAPGAPGGSESGAPPSTEGGEPSAAPVGGMA